MSTEYKLSFTASEINEKLTKVDKLTKVNDGETNLVDTWSSKKISDTINDAISDIGGGDVDLSQLGITATADELNYVDGATSNIQTQLDGKADLNHNHLGQYAASSHSHTIAQISTLQQVLNGKANSSHTHSASEITIGTLPISNGGTGATTAEAARTNLDVYSKSEINSISQKKITYGTSDPSGGSNGDIYIKYS